MNRLLSLVLLLHAFFASAQKVQSYAFRHIDQQDGLLHNTVLDITQDADGFIWISTVNGLQRFDGIRFYNYQSKLQTLPGFASIANISADNQKNVWLTADGIGRLNTTTLRFDFYNEEEIVSNPMFQFVNYNDKDNKIFLLSKYGLFTKDSNKGLFRKIVYSLPLHHSKYGNELTFDSAVQGTWFSGGMGLMLFDEKTKRIYSHTFNPVHHPLLQSFSGKDATSFFIDNSKNIWIGSWTDILYRYNSSLKKLEQYSFKKIWDGQYHQKQDEQNITVNCIFQDAKGTVWVGTEHDGLFRYNRDNNSFDNIDFLNSKENSPENYSVYCINEDKDGNIWLGTDEGINIFNPYVNYFQSATHFKSNKQSLPPDEINAIIQSHDGTVYIGTWGGGFSIFDSSLQFKKTIIPKKSFDYPLTWCFAEADDNTIWIGAQHGFIHQYFPSTGRLKTIHPLHNSSTIRCMAKDKEGNIWMGLHNGNIVKWEKSNDSFSIIPLPQQMNNNPIAAFIFDDQKSLWAGSEKGLIQIDMTSESFKANYFIVKNRKENGSFPVHSIAQLNDSVLLVSVLHNGVYEFNFRSKKFSPFEEASLKYKNIYAIQKTNNDVWMTSDYEIYHWVSSGQKLVKYKLDPALLKSSFELSYFILLKNGKLISASSTEALAFDPTVLTTFSYRQYNVVITGFKVFDNNKLADSSQSTKELQLKSNQNFVTIQYANLSYLSPTGNLFYYRLSGVDKSWVMDNGNGFASYTNLSPGSYLFEVKGNNSDTATVTRFHFTIHPPVYLRWWFVTSIILLFAFGVIALVRRRINAIRYKAELTHRISQAEMNALRAQMNPHFIFNCLNAIDNMIQIDKKEKATVYLNRFAKLIRGVLESSKNTLVPLHKDVETMELYLQLEQFRCDNKFEYQLKVEPQLLNGDYKIPPLITQPFIENAIHHGLMNKEQNDRTLSISISLEKEKIYYRIYDNGVGRKVAEKLKILNRPEHNSYGIPISTERLQIYNGKNGESAVTITDLYENEKPSGTLVEVLIKADG